MVAEHYPRLGFAQYRAPTDATREATFWRLDIESLSRSSHFIEVKA